MRPPTSVHFSCGSTASISATFSHGPAQPPGGLGTSMVGRSATEVLQRPVERFETCPSLTYIQGLRQIQRREYDATTR